jgi:hypothetical protein
VHDRRIGRTTSGEARKGAQDREDGREMRIEIAAAITNGKARRGAQDREDGPGEAHRKMRLRNACWRALAIATRVEQASASHRNMRCVSLQADLRRHSVGPAGRTPRMRERTRECW